MEVDGLNSDDARAQAAPAPPILASTLLEIARSNPKYGHGKKRKRIGSGNELLDEELLGGLTCGDVTIISGDNGVGKSTLALHVLASHLLSDPNSFATVLDSAGSFDVLRLHTILEFRLRTQQQTAVARRYANQELDLEWDGKRFKQDDAYESYAEQAANILNRVGLSRVFDYWGLVDGVREFKDGIERDIVQAKHGQSNICQTEHIRNQSSETESSYRRHVVADSDEDEDEDEDENENENHGQGSHSMVLDELREKAKEQTGTANPAADEELPQRTYMLIIDDLTSVLSSMMKSNYVRANALLAPFLRHLAHLTQSHAVCTIVVNSTVPLRRAQTAPAVPTGNTPPTLSSSPYDASDPRDQRRFAEDNPSIFASNTAKPALGSTFMYHADLHLLMTRVVKSKGISGAANAGDVQSSQASATEHVTVVEVLSDRWDRRVGRWAPLSIGTDGHLRNGV